MLDGIEDEERWKSPDISDLCGASVAFSLMRGTNLEFSQSGKCLSCDSPGHSQVGTPLSIVSLPEEILWLDSSLQPIALPSAVFSSASTVVPLVQ